MKTSVWATHGGDNQVFEISNREELVKKALYLYEAKLEWYEQTKLIVIEDEDYLTIEVQGRNGNAITVTNHPGEWYWDEDMLNGEFVFLVI